MDDLLEELKRQMDESGAVFLDDTIAVCTEAMAREPSIGEIQAVWIATLKRLAVL